MADRPTVTPSARTVLPPSGYEEFKHRKPFADFPDLERFTDGNPELTQFFVDHPEDPLTERWLTHARRVVPESLPEIMEHRSKSAMLWKVIGRALSLSADNAGGVLAELYWVKKDDPTVRAQRNDLTKLLTRPELEAFGDKLAVLTKGEYLPASAKGKMASIGKMTSISFGSHGKKQVAAKEWLETWIRGRQKDLVTDHGSAEKWLKDLGEDTTLGYDRALDRLADVITSFDGHRVCVAVLHKGREIGICANHPDDLMGADLEALLHASRAAGAEAKLRIDKLAGQMGGRGGEANLLTRSKARAKERLVKTVAFLRMLEQRFGRIRVIPYVYKVREGPRNDMEVHAEMVALAIGRKRPGAGLGVGKLCCFKCWLALQAWQNAFLRKKFATHMKTYPWPPPQFLTEPEALPKLFSSMEKSPPDWLRAALANREMWPALFNAIYLAMVPEGGSDTGYPSSEDDSMDGLYAKVSFGIDAASHDTVSTDREEKEEKQVSVDPEAEPELEALFDAHLDRDPVRPEDELPAPADDIPPPIQRDESVDRAAPAMDTPLRKTRREAPLTPAPRITPTGIPQPGTLESFGFTSNRPPSSSSSSSSSSSGRRTATGRTGSAGRTRRKATTSRKRKRNN